MGYPISTLRGGPGECCARQPADQEPEFTNDIQLDYHVEFRQWLDSVLILINAGRAIKTREYAQVREDSMRMSGQSRDGYRTIRRAFFDSLLATAGNWCRTDKHNRTPFHWAAWLRNPVLTEALFRAGAGELVNYQDQRYGCTASHLLCDPLGWYWKDAREDPMDQAVRTPEGEVKCIDFLVKGGGKVNLQDKEGDTPLMKACRWSRREQLVKSLLEHGADLKIRNRIGQTALRIAYNVQRTGYVQTLIESGATFQDMVVRNELDDSERTVLGDLLQSALQNQMADVRESYHKLITFLSACRPGQSDRGNFAVSVNLIGDSGVGKTSVAKSLVGGVPFLQLWEDRTIGITVYELKIKKFNVIILDHAGQESYKLVHHLTSNPFGINLLFLDVKKMRRGDQEMYDPQWFKHQVEPWVDLITVRNPEPLLAFVLPKCDLLSKKEQEQMEKDLIGCSIHMKDEKIRRAEEWATQLEQLISVQGCENVAQLSTARKNIAEARLAKNHHPLVWDFVHKIGLVGEEKMDSLMSLKQSIEDMIHSTELEQYILPLQGVPSPWYRLRQVLGELRRQDGRLFIRKDEFEAYAKEVGVSPKEMENCLTYLKVTGSAVVFECLTRSHRQYVFHNPDRALHLLGHLFLPDMASRLSRYIPDGNGNVEIILKNEGIVPGSVLCQYMAGAGVITSLDKCEEQVDSLLTLGSCLQVFIPLLNSEEDSELKPDYFLPSLVHREKEDIPDFNASLWPATEEGMVEFKMFLRLERRSMPDGFFARLSVVMTQYTQQKVNWRNGCWAVGIKVKFLVEAVERHFPATLRFTLRYPQTKPEFARMELIWLYRACVQCLSYFPGLLSCITAFCDCPEPTWFTLSDYLQMDYEELCDIRCSSCTNGKRAVDYLPVVVPEDIMETHSRVISYLREAVSDEEADVLIYKCRESRSLSPEQSDPLLGGGMAPLLTFLCYDTKVIRPGEYEWLRNAMVQASLNVAVDYLDHILSED